MAITDKFTQIRTTVNPVVATVSSARSIGGTTLSCGDLTGWPATVHFITYKKTATGAIDKTTQCDWKGIVSGTTIGSLTLKSGSDAGNAIGDYVEMAPTAAWGKDLIDGLSAEHNASDGKHSDITTTSITNAGDYNQSTGTFSVPAGAIQTAALAANSVTPAKMLGVDIFACSAALAGTVPTAGTGQFYLQGGTSVVTLSGNNGTVTFPTAFPNGLLTVVAVQGDSTGGFNAVTLTNELVTGFNISIPAAGSVSVRINWIAIGF